MDEYDPHGGRAYAQRRADKTTDAKFMDVCIGTEGGREVCRACRLSKANMTAKNRRAACGTIFRRRILVIPKPRANRITS